MDQRTLTTPAATGPRRPALHLRPCPPELRDALRALAEAEGRRLYEYLLTVLDQHVQERRRPSTEASTATAPEHTSA
jgi:hypothetical protein